MSIDSKTIEIFAKTRKHRLFQRTFIEAIQLLDNINVSRQVKKEKIVNLAT